MDKYWEKRLKENRVEARVEGAFDRANRASLNEKYPGYKKDDKHPQGFLSSILTENEEFIQKQQDLLEIRDYLYEQYGTDAISGEKLQEELREFGKKGKDHFNARRMMDFLLHSNAGRSDRWHSQLMTGKFGPSEQLGLAGAEIFADEKSLPLAKDFLGLQQDPAGKGRGLAKSDLLKRKPHTETPGRSEARQHQAEQHKASAGNPFNLKTPDLKLQSALLEQSPVLAQQLILSAGRDPRLFGL